MKRKLLIVSMFSFSTYVLPMHVNIPDYAEQILEVIHRIPTQERCEDYLQAIWQYPLSECQISSPICAEYYTCLADYGMKEAPAIVRMAVQRHSVFDLQKIVLKNWEYYMQICQSKSEDTMLISNSGQEDNVTSNIPMIISGISLAAAVYYVGIPWMKRKLMHLKSA